MLALLLILVLVIGGVIGFAIKKAPEEPKATPTPTPIPVTIPNDPSNLVASVITSGRIDLSWNDNSDNEAGFKIERRTETEGSYKQIATVGPDITTYADRGVVENTTYYYRVRAYNALGHSSYSNEDTTTTLPPTYHIMGGTAAGSKQSVSVAAMTKTNRYYEYQGWDPSTYKYQAPLGSAFVVVTVSTTNLSNAPSLARRVDFALRDAATRDAYGFFNYTWGDVGAPFPNITLIPEGETTAGVILYMIPQTASLSGMEIVYVLDDEIHIWKP
jgi:hypothetical protein